MTLQNPFKSRGGVKHKELDEGREHILWFLEKFGEKETLEQFHLEKDTLEALKNPENYPRISRVTKQALAEARELVLAGEVKELRVKAREVTKSVKQTESEVEDLKTSTIKSGDDIVITLRIPVPAIVGGIIEHKKETQHENG